MTLKLMRGDTHCFKFRRIDNDGNPILQIADAVYFTVKSNINDIKAVLQKTLADMNFDSSTGYYSFIITPDDTNKLQVGVYFYDIEVKIGDDYVRTISDGKLIIKADVTRPVNEVTNGTDN